MAACTLGGNKSTRHQTHVLESSKWTGLQEAGPD